MKRERELYGNNLHHNPSYQTVVGSDRELAMGDWEWE